MTDKSWLFVFNWNFSHLVQSLKVSFLLLKRRFILTSLAWNSFRSLVFGGINRYTLIKHFRVDKHERPRFGLNQTKPLWCLTPNLWSKTKGRVILVILGGSWALFIKVVTCDWGGKTEAADKGECLHDLNWG